MAVAAVDSGPGIPTDCHRLSGGGGAPAQVSGTPRTGDFDRAWSTTGDVRMRHVRAARRATHRRRSSGGGGASPPVHPARLGPHQAGDAHARLHQQDDSQGQGERRLRLHPSRPRATRSPPSPRAGPFPSASALRRQRQRHGDVVEHRTAEGRLHDDAPGRQRGRDGHPDIDTGGDLEAAGHPPRVRHHARERDGYASTFGSSPAADPYLATTLPSKGALLKNYYGIGHFSNDNYDAHRPPVQSPEQRLPSSDCIGTYCRLRRRRGPGRPGHPTGCGLCVYPAAVQTVANQLNGEGLTWEGRLTCGGHGQRSHPRRRPHVGTRRSGRAIPPSPPRRVTGMPHSGTIPSSSFHLHPSPTTPPCATRTSCRLGDTQWEPASDSSARHHRPGHRPGFHRHHTELQLHHPEPV